MAGAAIFAGRILLVLILLAMILLVWMAGGLIRGKLVMVRVLLHDRSAVRVWLTLLRNGGMAITAHRLHGDRNGQRVAAEERQPDGQNHRDKFSKSVQHMGSFAKLGSSVK